MLGKTLLGHPNSSFSGDFSVVASLKYPLKMKLLGGPEVYFLTPSIFLKLGYTCTSTVRTGTPAGSGTPLYQYQTIVNV